MASNGYPSVEVAARWAAGLRTSVIVSAIIGVVLGLMMVFWPGITLLVIAWILGIALIIAGLHRIVFGFSTHVPRAFRWPMAILGALMVFLGLLCLARPVGTLLFIAIVIGLGWIFEGIYDVVAGITGRTIGPRWVALVGGVMSVIAGIVMLTIPGLALSTFAIVGGILLIVVSIVTLATLPGKVTVR